MSVTIGFLPAALIYMTTLGVGALLESRCSDIPQQVLDENEASRDQLNRLLYPNLYAARSGIDHSRAETSAEVPLSPEESEPRSLVRATFMQDWDFARKTADSLGAAILPTNDGFAFLYKDCGFVLYRSEPEAACDLWILGTRDENLADSLAEEIEAEYKRLVQDHVHAALLERSSQYGLTLESEEVRSDRSVVITFTV